MQKAFAALGRELQLVTRPALSYRGGGATRPAMVAEREPIPYGQAALDGVDITQILDARRRSPDERLRYLASGARGMRAFLDSVKR